MVKKKVKGKKLKVTPEEAKELLEILEENFAKELDEQITRAINRAIDETKKHGWYMDKELLTKVIKFKLKWRRVKKND